MMNRFGFDQYAGRVPATFDRSLSRGNGYLVSIISKTDFSFDGRASSSQEIPIAIGVDSSAWVSGILVVRIHAKGTLSASAIATIKVNNISLVPEEPDVVYRVTATTVVTSANITSSTTVPGLDVKNFTAPIGPLLGVYLAWDQGGTAAGAAQTLSLSVDLVGRPA